MLRITNLKKAYGKFNVLNGLNMTLEKGDVYGFLGKNGCGKTTTMNIVCNLIKKDEGSIVLGEKPDDKIKIGYLPETPALFGYMNGYEYLDYIAACCKWQGDVKARTAEVLDIVGMTEGGKRRIKGYSRGMNQRLGIAAAMYNNPDLLILDEPTSALDPQGRADVMNIIRELTGNQTTILLCTHILSDVERVANKIGMISDGVMKLEGNIGDILRQRGSNDIEVYLHNTDERSINLMKAIPFAANVDFYDKTKCFVIRTDNSENTAGEFIRYCAANDLVPLKMEVTKPTLEQIYIEEVGGSAD